MNKLYKLLAGALLVSVVVGCKAPPSFSPDGKSIAYSNGSAFYLRSHGRATRLDTQRPDEVAWSPDARFVAWATGDGSKKPGHQTTVSVADAASKKTVRREVDAEGIAWLNGQLLCTTGESSELLTLDPRGLKTLAKRPTPVSSKKIYSSPRLREAYLETTGDHVFVYDGSKFRSMPCPVQSVPVATAGGDVAFMQLSPNGARNVSVWRKKRQGFEKTMTADIAQQLGPNETVVAEIIRISVSDDGKTFAARAMTYDGTLAQRQQFLQLADPIDPFAYVKRGPDQPSQREPQIDELTRHMKQGAGVLIYKRGGLKEWIPFGKNDDDIALEPGGRRLSIASDTGIRMVNLKP